MSCSFAVTMLGKYLAYRPFGVFKRTLSRRLEPPKTLMEFSCTSPLSSNILLQRLRKFAYHNGEDTSRR